MFFYHIVILILVLERECGFGSVGLCHLHLSLCLTSNVYHAMAYFSDDDNFAIISFTGGSFMMLIREKKAARK